MAASNAFPPYSIISNAFFVASGCEVDTIAFCAYAGERDGMWRFLITIDNNEIKLYYLYNKM